VESRAKAGRPVNNDIYGALGARWYEAQDDPVALLRAESKLRNPWVARTLGDTFGARPCSVLDVGCGAGFLSNYLATLGHRVSGLDAASDSLDVAAHHDATGTVRYEVGNALELPYPDGAFDVVCAMDFLEHVEEPDRVIAEAARVLSPSGLFFFPTFNRNWLAWLIVIKGVEWFVRNTPRDMHVLHLFLTPEEVTAMCLSRGLLPVRLLGSRPLFGTALLKMLATGRVPEEFGFTFSRSTRIAFSGFARKAARRPDASAPSTPAH
jgi:2-polyprenyl-6-hydroxyphenyl methylase / 3-demethylubiquinone-9 3-methyltransferase